MKKILLAVLAVLMICTLSIALVSCGHECVFSTDWSSDATHHWHACTHKGCEESADKAEHIWGDGVITTPATATSEGVMTYTCTVCQGTKTEVIEKCVYSTDWSKDETHHWHACVTEKCDGIADKASHNWDNGTITTPATQGADGVKTFTCSDCGQTKTEKVVFTGLSNADWYAAFNIDLFKNFTYKELGTTSAPGFSIQADAIYKFTEGKATITMTIAGSTESESITNKTQVEALRQELIDSIKAIAKHGSFDYDAETKTYKANKNVYIEALDASTSNITIKFDDSGKFIGMDYTVTITEGGMTLSAVSEVTITYGDVAI